MYKIFKEYVSGRFEYVNKTLQFIMIFELVLKKTTRIAVFKYMGCIDYLTPIILYLEKFAYFSNNINAPHINKYFDTTILQNILRLLRDLSQCFIHYYMTIKKKKQITGYIFYINNMSFLNRKF